MLEDLLVEQDDLNPKETIKEYQAHGDGPKGDQEVIWCNSK
jgi:hypothetical protein